MFRFYLAIFILVSALVGASTNGVSTQVSESFITSSTQLSEIDTTQVDDALPLRTPLLFRTVVAPDSAAIIFTEAAIVPTTFSIIRAPPTAQ
jgi:hypothetical protein